jgi:hypothetical protein
MKKTSKIAVFLIIKPGDKSAWEIYTSAVANPNITLIESEAMNIVKGIAKYEIASIIDLANEQKMTVTLSKKQQLEYIFVSETNYQKNIGKLTAGYDMAMFYRPEDGFPHLVAVSYGHPAFTYK